MIFDLLIAVAATQPSFDCARARTRVEHAICASEELARLDREEARIYAIALRTPQAHRPQLILRQRRFLRDRDGCTESSQPLSECVRDAYLWDIGDLRRLGEVQDDNEGLSSGPIRFRCDQSRDVYVALYATDPAQGFISVPAVNEGQPLVADSTNPHLLVGRYATDYVYDTHTRRVRVGNASCVPG